MKSASPGSLLAKQVFRSLSLESGPLEQELRGQGTCSTRLWNSDTTEVWEALPLSDPSPPEKDPRPDDWTRAPCTYCSVHLGKLLKNQSSVDVKIIVHGVLKVLLLCMCSTITSKSFGNQVFLFL